MKNSLLVSQMVMACAFGAGPEDDITSALVNRVDESKRAVGMVVGVIDAHGQRVVGRGRLEQSRTVQPDGDTVFEIGSITKVFTSLLLADMVERGEVGIDDPVAKFLPAGVTAPTRNGRQITLKDLSMQVSGLPPLPDNISPADLSNPYAGYKSPALYEFLARYKLTRDIGEKYEYSNLGAGLLGHALSLKAGCSYEELVRRRILEPLGMKDTSIVLSGSQRDRLATGHNSAGLPAGNWDFDVLAGAGALRSTANDMLKFLAANLELTDTPLRAAMRRMRSVRRETGLPSIAIMMGWHVIDRFGTTILWHNGGTGGYRSFLGFDSAAGKGVVILCNTNLVPDDLGFHVLEPRYPVAKFTVAPQRGTGYVGEYEFAPGITFKIVQEGTRLFARAAGQPDVEMFAKGAREFDLSAPDTRVSFTADESGGITGLILHQKGKDTRASKIR
jgi:CubicO group peptidase (beta-lactamase class C family)